MSRSLVLCSLFTLLLSACNTAPIDSTWAPIVGLRPGEALDGGEIPDGGPPCVATQTVCQYEPDVGSILFSCDPDPQVSRWKEITKCALGCTLVSDADGMEHDSCRACVPRSEFCDAANARHVCNSQGQWAIQGSCHKHRCPCGGIFPFCLTCN
jgi:hypothetical protein